MTNPFLNMIGLRFKKLVVMGYAGLDRWNHTLWICRCDCGAVVVQQGSTLRRGKASSCGCKRSTFKLKHGQATDSRGRTPEYMIWQGMKSRCGNPKKDNYRHYGGRGIRVCVGWASRFEDFFRDMGKRPTPKHTIDRKNNNGHYSCGGCEECIANNWPMNCRWATKKEQNANTRRAGSGRGAYGNGKREASTLIIICGEVR